MGHETFEPDLPQKRTSRGSKSVKPKKKLNTVPEQEQFPESVEKPKPEVFPEIAPIKPEEYEKIRQKMVDSFKQAYERLGKDLILKPKSTSLDDGDIPPPPPQRPTEIQGAYKNRIAERKRSSIDPALFAQIEDPKLRTIITENANLWERYGIRLSIDYPYKDGVVVVNDTHTEITGMDKSGKPKIKKIPFKVSLSRATQDEALGVIRAVDKNVASILPEEFFSILYNESVSIAVVRDLKTKKGDDRTLETNGLDLLDGRETLMAVRSNPTRTLSENANKGDFDTASYAVLHETIHRWLHKYEQFDLRWPNALATIQDKMEFEARRIKVANGEIGVRPQGFTDWQAAFSGEESDDQVATIANLIWNPKVEFEKAKSDQILAQKIEIAKKIVFEVSQKLMDQDYWSFRLKGGDVQSYLESRRSVQLSKND